MKVSNYLRGEFCILNLASQDKEGAIREIAKTLANSNKVIDEEKFIKDVLERESLGSTGIGHNVAIPHARTESVKGFVIGFGRSPGGVKFKALDGQPVNIVFLMGADPRELNLYLRVLAELSRLLMNASFRKELMSAESPEQIVAITEKFEQA